MDPGSKVMMTQEFRHTMQNEGKKIAEFSRRLEKTFHIAYGSESISPETRDALLFRQLHEGLIYSLMEGPAVSDATSYQALCLAAKTEEKRQAELQKQRQYKPKGDHVPLIGKCQAICSYEARPLELGNCILWHRELYLHTLQCSQFSSE